MATGFFSKAAIQRKKRETHTDLIFYFNMAPRLDTQTANYLMALMNEQSWTTPFLYEGIREICTDRYCYCNPIFLRDSKYYLETFWNEPKDHRQSLRLLVTCLATFSHKTPSLLLSSKSPYDSNKLL